METATIGFTKSLVPTFQASGSRFFQWTLLSTRSVETLRPVRTSIWFVASHEKAISAFVSRDLPAKHGPQLAIYVWKAVVSHLGPCVWQQLLGDWWADPCVSSCSLLLAASSCSTIYTWRRWLSFVVAARWWSTRLHLSALTTRRSGESLFMLWQAWRYPMPNRFSSSNGDMVRQESNLPLSEAWILAPVLLQFSTSRLFRGWSDRRFSWWDSTSQIASGHRRPKEYPAGLCSALVHASLDGLRTRTRSEGWHERFSSQLGERELEWIQDMENAGLHHFASTFLPDYQPTAADSWIWVCTVFSLPFNRMTARDSYLMTAEWKKIWL